MQLDLFRDSESIVEKEAMLHTSESIYQSSGHRNTINIFMNAKDFHSAFIEYEKAFKNYGFSDNVCMFRCISGKGLIDIRGRKSISVTAKQLFNIFNDGWGK